MTNNELKKDAKNRALRTWLQGLVVTLFTAVAPIIHQAVSGGVENASWKLLGFAVLNAALLALLAYVHRTLIDPSGLPSASPPEA